MENSKKKKSLERMTSKIAVRFIFLPDEDLIAPTCCLGGSCNPLLITANGNI